MISMMKGKYTEKLRTGGDLTVTASSWSIEYYFSGPDLRYRGDFVTVKGTQIDQYISAWANNYGKYLELKKVMPANGTFTTTGEMNMTINVGGYAEGVCLRSYHMPVKSEEKMMDIIEDYEYAKKQAALMMKILQE